MHHNHKGWTINERLCLHLARRQQPFTKRSALNHCYKKHSSYLVDNMLLKASRGSIQVIEGSGADRVQLS